MRLSETQQEILSTLSAGPMSQKDLRLKTGNRKGFSAALDGLGESGNVASDSARRVIITAQGRRSLKSYGL